jgi:hypothetical protein
VTVAIAKANQEKPDGAKIQTTDVKDKQDGAISGVDETMEYSLDDGKTWNPVTGTTLSGLKAGQVSLRYAETKNLRASQPITLIIQEEKPEEQDQKTAKPDAKYTAKIELNKDFLVMAGTDRVTVKWGKVTGATKYKVYADYCGGNGAELIKTIKVTEYSHATSCVFKKIDGKSIKARKNVKVYVVAYGKNNKLLATSNAGHAAGAKSELYTNAKATKISADKTTLNVGERIKVKASVIAKDKNKQLLGHTKTIRFASSNPYVAKVTSSGRITAVGKGSCYIYAYAENGRSARIKIKVK